MHNVISKIYLEKLFESLSIQKLPLDLKFFFLSENSAFIRVNDSKIRQVTHVDQFELSISLKEDTEQKNISCILCGDLETDHKRIRDILESIFNIPIKPEMCEQFTLLQIPTSQGELELLEVLNEQKGLVGLFTLGKVYRGFICGGQQVMTWFETPRTDVDYSIYDEDLSVKETYSQNEFIKDDLIKSISKNKEILSSLKMEKKELTPSKLSVYLSPSAVYEIISTMNWYGVQANFIGDKVSALMDAFNGDRYFSKQFTIRENFDLALSPCFNEEGESSETIVDIIKEGKFISPLVNSFNAKKYGYKSNNANSEESFRSTEILSGNISEDDLIQKVKNGIYISNLHYLNWSNKKTASITGMTRFGCMYIDENGNKFPIKDMRFNVSLYDLFGDDLVSFSKERQIFCDLNTYERRHLSGMLVPGALTKMSFTL